MATVTYVQADGNSHEVELANGTTIMQGALDNMIDGILGDCGGSCSCATCHCYVDAAWVDKIPAASDVEKDLLDCVVDPQDNSRLSCQIVIDDSLDGLVVNLPASQF